MSPPAQDRLTNLVFAAIVASLFTVSSFLTPSPAGVGTHEQLKLPPCHFHKLTGIPCFSCGMTTSWAWMAHGHPWKSFQTQPMGAVLFVAAGAAGLWSLWCLFTSGTVESRLRGRGRVLNAVFWVGMLAAWAYKIVRTFVA
jgi:hypothetical protein